MSKKLTTDEFISKANIVHNNKYDYSLVEYINSYTKVKIICPDHGIFEQQPNNHISGKGCNICVISKRLSTIEYVISKANIIHNNKYDYSLVEYVNGYTKIKIICPEHGMFEQIPNIHLNGNGCSICAGSKKSSTQEFISKSINIHNNKYDYSLVEYSNNITKVKIICPLHGIFDQSPSSHLNGNGCPRCAKIKNLTTNSEFISKANDIHNNKYDYSLVEYINSYTKVTIICPEHGTFDQKPNSHLNGNSCPRCAKTKNLTTIDEFISKANIIHNNKYDYSLVEYITACIKIKITCPVHGVFWQTPNNHLSGHGCPICTHSISSQESEIYNFLKLYKISPIQSDRTILNGKELDIYIPSHIIAMEFDGIYWHSEGMGKNRSYHLNKTKDCFDNNIQLLHIFENEWNNHIKKEIWKSVILNKLGICSQKIFARKCTINEVDNKTAKQFLLNNHLQGHTPSSINIGLYYENELVSLMTFGKSRYNKSYQYELIRFCNRLNTVVVGGASKLFTYFIRNYKPESLISYADMRYSNGTLYEKLGFTKLKNSQPNYFYFHKSDTNNLMSRVQFQKHKLKDKLETFDIELTEYQNMLNNGYDRIWDCGNCVYKYNS